MNRWGWHILIVLVVVRQKKGQGLGDSSGMNQNFQIGATATWGLKLIISNVRRA